MLEVFPDAGQEAGVNAQAAGMVRGGRDGMAKDFFRPLVFLADIRQENPIAQHQRDVVRVGIENLLIQRIHPFVVFADG